MDTTTVSRPRTLVITTALGTAPRSVTAMSNDTSVVANDVAALTVAGDMNSVVVTPSGAGVAEIMLTVTDDVGATSTASMVLMVNGALCFCLMMFRCCSSVVFDVPSVDVCLLDLIGVFVCVCVCVCVRVVFM